MVSSHPSKACRSELYGEKWRFPITARGGGGWWGLVGVGFGFGFVSSHWVTLLLVPSTQKSHTQGEMSSGRDTSLSLMAGGFGGGAQSGAAAAGLVALRDTVFTGVQGPHFYTAGRRI